MPPKSPLHLLLLSCWLLLLLCVTAPLVLSETHSIGLWLMQAVPLLLTLPGVLKMHSRTLLWLAFLVLFCLLNGVLQVAGPLPVQRWLGALTLLLCLVLFTAVIVAVRRGRHPAPPSSTE